MSPLRRPVLAFLSLVLVGAALAGSPDKISPRILVHQARKQALAKLPAEKLATALAAAGAKSLDYELTALYVDRPLAKEEVNVLDAQGVGIHADFYVPPVPGHHPRGYYLADVRYSALDVVRADSRLVRAESVEWVRQPCNDLSAQMVRADNVLVGTTQLPAYNGTGVKVAIADSGCQLSHADFPTPVEAYDVTDGATVASWGLDVSNHVTAHGTHVCGTVLGSGGLSGGRYHGMAPGASFYFYKIGDDITASGTDGDIIKSIVRAAQVGCRVYSLSYGGYGVYMDGSEPTEQAIDAACDSGGMLSMLAAGNTQSSRDHASAVVAPGTSSPTFQFSVTNPNGTAAYTGTTEFGVIWRDQVPGDYNVSLTCSNLAAGETLVATTSTSSVRNTESIDYTLTVNFAAGTGSKLYTLQFVNSAASGDSPRVHLYRYGPLGGSIPSADPLLDKNYTLGGPADADLGVAVGAWVHRNQWTDWNGAPHSSSQTVGTLATFSSLGPRLDGVLAPSIVAPGSYTISCRDSISSTNNPGRIDNDGLNLNGSGPADYLAINGTSMATPCTSGVVAQIAQAAPLASPQDLKNILRTTAGNAASPNSSIGYGLIDAEAAILSISPTVTVDQAAAQPDPASSAPIHFTVHFSESVTDFAPSDVTLGGTASPTTYVITGGPQDYDVAVSGMSQPGTVTLGLPKAMVASTTLGAANQPSTSTDNVVTYTPSAGVEGWTTF